MRAQGDPEADAVIREIFEKGEVGAVNDLLRRLVENDEPVPPGLSPGSPSRNVIKEARPSPWDNAMRGSGGRER